MSAPDEWSAPGRPVPPPPSGYEAKPTSDVGPPPGGYLAQTYPAEGYPPPPEDGWDSPFGRGAPVDRPYGPAPGTLYGPPPGGPYGPPGGATYRPGYGPTDAPPTGTEGVAIAALVTGLVSLVACLVIAGPVAVWLGVLGLRNTAAKGTQGRGMAVAGLVTGAVATLLLIGFVAAFVVAATSS